MGEAPDEATSATLTLPTGGRHRTRDNTGMPETQDKCKWAVSETPAERCRTSPLDPTYAYDRVHTTGAAKDDDKAAVGKEAAAMVPNNAQQ